MKEHVAVNVPELADWSLTVMADSEVTLLRGVFQLFGIIRRSSKKLYI